MRMQTEVDFRLRNHHGSILGHHIRSCLRRFKFVVNARESSATLKKEIAF